MSQRQEAGLTFLAGALFRFDFGMATGCEVSSYQP